jgi:hypothetical protein
MPPEKIQASIIKNSKNSSNFAGVFYWPIQGRSATKVNQV